MHKSAQLSLYFLRVIALLLLHSGVLKCAVGDVEGFCSAPSTSIDSNSKPLYWKVTNPTLSPVHLQDLPGFTRSVYKRDHALITPESHVFSPLLNWMNTLGAYLITPEMGSHFVMYLAKMRGYVINEEGPRSYQLVLKPSKTAQITENSRSAMPPQDVERFLFVLQGTAILSNGSGKSDRLVVDSFAYLPSNSEHTLECETLATLIVFERRYANLENQIPEQIVGSTNRQPLLETAGEVFELRKLLPISTPYDFNIHGSANFDCMATEDHGFSTGEYLNVKEVHYNQHGLLLLEGQGIYRLGDSWYPVQAGDAIWMGPFVPQWYAALGKTRSRYLLYKDVNRNPL